MTQSNSLQGQCLCGAVKLRVTAADPTLRACHCDMCRRLTSGIYFSLMTDQDGMEVSGPFRTFASSDWAERAFCETCGAALWYSTRHDGARYLSAGLFDDAGGAALTVEYFEDCRPRGYRLAGDHRKMTRDETIALFTGTDD